MEEEGSKARGDESGWKRCGGRGLPAKRTISCKVVEEGEQAVRRPLLPTDGRSDKQT